jgi:hypothetical protein
MNPELEALARRTVACPRWRWMPGMLVVYAPGCLGRSRIGFVDSDGIPQDETAFSFLRIADQWFYGGERCLPPLPDLSDPATLGCLLVIVQEIASTIPDPPDGEMSHRMIYRLSESYRALMSVGLAHPDTARALVVALEAAP